MEEQKISFYPFRNLLIARVAVPKSFKDASLNAPQDYEIYYSSDGKTLTKDKPESKNDEFYIYCLKKNNFKLSIPYGIPGTNGYNFLITATVTEKQISSFVEKILSGYFSMRNAWTYENIGKLTYEYINEFNIDNNHHFGGLSIVFRDEFKELFTPSLNGYSSDKEHINQVLSQLKSKYEISFNSSEVSQ